MPATPSPKRYYFALRIKQWDCLTVAGMTLKAPEKDCAGFIMVYATKEAALREHAEAEICEVETVIEKV